MDCEKTVMSSKIDSYLPPVMWIVFGKRTLSDVLIILSSCEVNNLLLHIRSSNKIRLHLYMPRITKSMKPCDDLALYIIPAIHTRWTPSSSLMNQLDVFAGQF